MLNLTEQERDFLHHHLGGFLGALMGGENDKTLTRRNAAEAVKVLQARFPSRTERLLVFALLAEILTTARDELLDELLLGALGPWTRRDDGQWCANAIQPHEVPYLASLAGLSDQTIRNRFKRLVQDTLEAAQREVGEIP